MEPLQIFQVALTVLFFVGLGVGLNYWGHFHGKKMLYLWAEDNQLSILSCKRCWFYKGPFFYTKGTIVFYISARNQQDQYQEAYVRCGSPWGGVFVNQVEARWQ